MVFSGKTKCVDGFTAYLDENMKKVLSIIISQWTSDFHGNFRGIPLFWGTFYGVFGCGYDLGIWVFGYWVTLQEPRVPSFFFWRGKYERLKDYQICFLDLVIWLCNLRIAVNHLNLNLVRMLGRVLTLYHLRLLR